MSHVCLEVRTYKITLTYVELYVTGNCTDGDIKLVGGTVSYEGRVELCVHGVWGTICHDAWDQKDSTVVCRQLGLPYQCMS